jgi:metallo-beta-lactamase class B
MGLHHKNFMGLAVAIGWLGMASVASAGDPPEWSAPVKPFQIAHGIYYVGTEGLAAYLIVSNQGAILLDGTTAENAALVERNIETVGVGLRDVKLLLSDHAHSDHVGALAKIKQDTGAQVLASAGDRWALEHGQIRSDVDYTPTSFAPVKVDRLVRDGETIRLGEVSLTAHLTPGHTAGCTSWSMTVDEGGARRQVLFVCSLTVAGNILAGNHAYPEIAADYRQTFDKLAAMKTDILLTSHPAFANVLGREARRERGEANAFIDPTALPSLVAASKRSFEREMAAAKRSHP